MTIIKQGDLTTVTVSPEAEKRMIEFERQAIEQNMVVQQHGATMLVEQPVVKTSTTAKASSLEIYRVMKKIAGVQDTFIPSTLELFQPHIASSNVASKKEDNSNKNIVLMKLMKRIANSASPFSL